MTDVEALNCDPLTGEPESLDDLEAKRIMAEWDKGNDTESSDGESLTDEGDFIDPEDELEPFRRDVSKTDNTLDHIVLGTSDLAQAMDDFETLMGLRPVMVISMNGLGTKSARVSFEGCSYLEIIAPDPKQPSTPLADALAQLETGEMVPLHYAVRKSNACDLKRDTWPEMGLGCDQVTMVAKDRGMPWNWDLFFLQGHGDGGLVPFFINWGESVHACSKLPIVGSLDSVTVKAPANNAVHRLLEGVDDITVESNDKPLLEFTLTSKTGGQHTFSSSSPIGISFPVVGGLPVKHCQ